MLSKVSRGFVAVAITSVLGLGIARAQAPATPATPAQTQPAGPQWKDRGEYDLYQSIAKETDPNKKLDLLKNWRDKYPNTDFKVLRLQQFMATYQALNNGPEMFNTAKQILAEDPKNASAALAVLLLVPTMGPQNTDAQTLAEKVANQVASGVDEMKPAGAPEDAWNQLKHNLVLLAPRDLGWIAFQRKNYQEAEKQLTASVKQNPNDAEAYTWLAAALYSLDRNTRISDVLYYYARADVIEGPGALPAPTKAQIDAYLTKLYTAYHGKDDAGLAQLKQEAKASPVPPAGFKILSETEVTNQKEAALAQSNPSLAFWLKLKGALQEENGQQYFDQGMKGALVPPEGQPPLRGKLVSQEPARNPKTLRLALSDATTPEVTLKLDTPLTGSAEPGTDISFRGIPSAFTKEPFNVTFDVEKANLSGWPAAAPAKKGGAKKGVVRRKK